MRHFALHEGICRISPEGELLGQRAGAFLILTEIVVSLSTEVVTIPTFIINVQGIKCAIELFDLCQSDRLKMVNKKQAS